ncbi:MAG: porin [Bacteroidetes bacterium MedPE-SWsnd-G2]|nr:MAG: porin [Bacteroidetes bacterium MedPE-SWsnd-G2]
MKLFLSVVIVSCFAYFPMYSQSNKLKINLDETGKTYIKGSLRGQFWARYMEMNPGSTVNGELTSHKFDFSIRRIRIGVSAQLTPKLFVYGLFGGNNINFKTAQNFDFDVLDFSAEYAFSDSFTVGGGESGWNGLSRWTVRSSKSLMALDAPLFTLFTVNKNDDLGRSLGMWIKGQIGKWDYVLALNSPNSYGVVATEGVVDFALNNPRMRTSGYLKYEFWDNESNKTAYSGGAGTYLGKKRILNVGAGYLFQGNMMSSIENGEETYYDFSNWAAEVFLDQPLNTEKGTAITAYLGYFNTDFGPDYVRNIGANDYTSGGTSFNGSGNDYPMVGTGDTWFLQFGYLLGKGKQTFQFQPNIAIQYSNFDGLEDAMTVYDIGINMLIKGHDNKLTLSYQGRPIYVENNMGELVVDERRGQIILQYQISIN